MDSLYHTEEQENEQSCEQLNVAIIIKEFHVLEQSQLPSTKEKKARAIKQAKQMIATSTGKNLDEKQIVKKFSNMKVQVEKKTDKNQTGNRKVVLSPWEEELYKIMQGDENPNITKMPSSISAGFQRSSTTVIPSTGLSTSPSHDVDFISASTSSMNIQPQASSSRSRPPEPSPSSSRASTSQPM